MQFKFKVTELDRFLQEELTISSAEIALLMYKQEELNAPIPMLVWQYNIVSCLQLDCIFDWLEACSWLTPLNIKEYSHGTNSN